MTIHHMSGAGNRFVVIDNRDEHLDLTHLHALAPALCDRRHLDLPPAEGLLVLQDVMPGGFSGEFLNPDGSHGAMCGNGGRCIVRFALDNGAETNDDDVIDFTLSGEGYSATLSGNDMVTLEFPAPKEVRQLAPGELHGISVPSVYVNVNSDHIVLYGPDLGIAFEHLRTSDLDTIALPFRHHPAFARGVNVNIYAVDEDGTIHLRTFERGVEAETGACGTGALSTTIAAWLSERSGPTARVIPPSRRPLFVTIHEDHGDIRSLDLTGDAIYDHAPTLHH